MIIQIKRTQHNNIHNNTYYKQHYNTKEQHNMKNLSSTITVSTLLLSTIAKSTAFVPSTPYKTTSLQQRPTLQRRGSSLGNNILNHKEKRHVSEVISSRTKQHYTPLLHMVSVSAPSSPDSISVRDEIYAMRLADIKKELDSYGVDSNAFFEKKELVEALVKARQEEWIHNEFETTSPPFDTSASTSSSSNDYGSSFDRNMWEVSAPSSTSTSSSSSSKKKKGWFQSFKDNVTDQFDKGVENIGRKARVDLEMAKLKDVKTKDLKKELESYGINTRSFFEKKQMIKAVAEARVDGVKKTSRASSKYSRSSTQSEEEVWDPSFQNVYCRKFDASTIDPSGVIDIRAR